MTDNRTTELVSRREATTLLEEFLCGYQNILLSRGINASEAVCKQNELIDEYSERIEQAITTTLGVDVKDYENLLWEFIGALDVADATDADKKPIVSDYARHIAATLGGGTLAIEQIKDAVLKNFHYDHLKPPLFDWQAIADELNATLGSGTLREVCQNGGKGAAAQALQPLLKEPGDIGGTPLLELGA